MSLASGLASGADSAPAASAVAPTAAAATGAAPKPYTLYMGADVAIEWEGQLRPVQDVEGSAFILNVNGRRVQVPVRFTNLKIKLDEALKVSANRATVADFKAERAYTLDADPKRHYEEAAQYAMGAAAVSDLANAKLNELQSVMGRTTGGAQNASMQSQVAQASSAQQSSYFAQSSPINSIADAGVREAQEAARELYDAFALTFEISAPKPLVKPYIVVVTHYLENPERPDTGRIWVYAQALDRVDPEPQKFRMMRGGFPPGYKLGDVQMHLYDGTTELATNVARKRVELTADEAFQLSVVEFVQQHRDATVQPAPVKTLVPRKLMARLRADDRTFYVKVAKNGEPTGVFLDPPCREKLTDADLATALLALRFTPALDKGKPVEGVAPVELDRLSQ